jgi:hypothetical protein
MQMASRVHQMRPSAIGSATDHYLRKLVANTLQAFEEFTVRADDERGEGEILVERERQR